MTVCPCCQREVEGVLAPDQVAEFARLTTMERRVFDFLARRFGMSVSTAELVDFAYADDPDGGPDTADATIRVYTHRLRRKLAQYGITIKGKGNGRNRDGETRMMWMMRRPEAEE